MGLQISFQHPVLVVLCTSPDVGLLDHRGVLFFSFHSPWGTFIPFSVVAKPVHTASNSAWEFPPIHTLTSTPSCLSEGSWAQAGEPDLMQSLVVCGAEGPPIPLWAIGMSLWENRLFGPSGKLEIERFIVVWITYIYLDINPLPDMWLANIFVFHSVGCFWVLLRVLFALQSFLVWQSFQFFVTVRCFPGLLYQSFCSVWTIPLNISFGVECGVLDFTLWQDRSMSLKFSIC